MKIVYTFKRKENNFKETKNNIFRSFCLQTSNDYRTLKVKIRNPQNNNKATKM